MSLFKPAVKVDAKLRLALCGPAGSGKTYTLLTLATHLGGPIAYVDTEHGSASKYADLFKFDVIEPDVFDPRKLIEFIDGAIEDGYKVICIDSLSHYWMGTGGELDLVDAAAKKSQSGNSFAAWKNVTPIHNKLVDTIIGAQIHVLVSMRTKTEWVIEENDKGKKTPRKIGLAPVMRDGIEFEFDVCGDLDQDNTLVITKSRCPELSGKVINRPGKDMAVVLKRWLSVEPSQAQPALPPQPKPAQQPPPPTPASGPFKATDEDIPASMGGTWVDPENRQSADKHIEEMRSRQSAPPTATQEKPWTTFKGMIACFERLKIDLVAATGNDAAYYGELDLYDVKHANGFKNGADALKCYEQMKKKLAMVAGSVAA